MGAAGASERTKELGSDKRMGKKNTHTQKTHFVQNDVAQMWWQLRRLFVVVVNVWNKSAVHLAVRLRSYQCCGPFVVVYHFVRLEFADIDVIVDVPLHVRYSGLHVQCARGRV